VDDRIKAVGNFCLLLLGRGVRKKKERVNLLAEGWKYFLTGAFYLIALGFLVLIPSVDKMQVKETVALSFHKKEHPGGIHLRIPHSKLSLVMRGPEDVINARYVKMQKAIKPRSKVKVWVVTGWFSASAHAFYGIEHNGILIINPEDTISAIRDRYRLHSFLVFLLALFLSFGIYIKWEWPFESTYD